MDAGITAPDVAPGVMRGLRREHSAGLQAQPSQTRLKELCNQMESIFISVLMRQMRQTVWKSDFLPEADGEDIFRSMWETEVAGRMQKGTGGFGIADAIYRELERAGECRKNALDSQSSSL